MMPEHFQRRGPNEYREATFAESGEAMRGHEILDACCGGRHWWWDKAHPLAVYMDKREAPMGTISFRPNWNCSPDLLGDFRSMPFEDESFQLVVFDPPHLIRPSDKPTGVTGTKYGVLARATASSDLANGLAECWRVLRRGGTLIFKWSGALDLVEPHFPAQPIVGTRTRAETRWIVFYKPCDPDYSQSFQDEYQRLWHREAELRRCNVQMPGGDGNQLCDLWPDHEGQHMNAAESAEWGGKKLRFSRG